MWLLHLPFGRTVADSERCTDWFARLQAFTESLHPDSVVCILTTAEDAAVTWPKLANALRFQLWVSIKLDRPHHAENPSRLPQHHAALLVLTKYNRSLRHTKTRIAYTFCPACDKTTKDYGGKKHTYHAFGTLMSDVWRDITYSPNAYCSRIVERLADIFGTSPHHRLNVISLIRVKELLPLSPASSITAAESEPRTSAPLAISSRLIQGDCLSALRELPDSSIDFCFADPPYNLAKRYDTWNDAIELNDYFAWCDEWLDEMSRVVRPGRTCAVLNIPLWAIRHFEHMRKNLQFQNWIVWEGLSLPVRMIMPAHYSILCFTKGAALPLSTHGSMPAYEAELLRPLKEDFCVRAACVRARSAAREDRVAANDLWWDIHRLKHNSRRVDHPCQLPPKLMRRLIGLFTVEGEVVLDPFNGAGTTTLCAAEMGRRFVGIELSEKYHTLAQERHDLLKRGGDPFAKVRAVPGAKNSRVKRIGQMRYQVSKKTLQLDVRRIAAELGRLPKREEVAELSQYPMTFFDKYFISWGEVCAAARNTGMSEHRSKPQLQTAPESSQLPLFE